MGTCDVARADIDSGNDPNARKRAGDAEVAMSADTFEVIVREWYNAKSSTWAPMHAERVLERLQLHTAFAAPAVSCSDTPLQQAAPAKTLQVILTGHCVHTRKAASQR